MKKCCVCKEPIVSGYVVCGQCAGKNQPNRFAPELSFYINELAKTLMLSIDVPKENTTELEYRDEIRSWLTEKATGYFSRAINV